MADLNIDIEVKVNEGEAGLVKLRKELQNLQKASVGINEQFQTNEDKLTAIGNKKADINALSKSVADLKKAFDVKPIIATDNALNDLNKELDQLIQKQKNLKREQKEVADQTSRKGILGVGTQRDFDNQALLFKKFAESQEQVFGPLKEGFGIGFAVKGIDLLIDAIGNLVESFKESVKITQELRKEIVSLGVTGEDVTKVLNSTFVTISNTGKDATEVLRAQEVLVKQFGITWEEAGKIISRANDSILGKEYPILNATHSLPFIVRQYAKNPFSIYGT